MSGSYVDEDYAIVEETADSDESSVGRHRLRQQLEADGTTTAWGYLGVLCLLALGLTAFAKGCDGRETNQQGEAVAMAVSETEMGNPIDLRINVDGDTVTLVGSVPDEAARSQLVSATAVDYGDENVIDQLQIDPETTLVGGLVSVVGSTEVGDVRPEKLQKTIADNFGLTARANSISRGDQVLTAADVEINVSPDGAVKVFGAVPDQSSLDDIVAVAVEVWGITSTDSSGLSIDENVTWEQGRVRVTGSTTTGDERANGLEALVAEKFGALASTDISALAVEEPSATIEEIETGITTKLATQPILFAPESLEIDIASDAVLKEIAELLALMPTAAIELVGHTDNIGPESDNLELSEQRANAVRQRLIDDGVDEARISARGAGEAEPLVDNDSAQNRTLNRRIEFVITATEG